MVGSKRMMILVLCVVFTIPLAQAQAVDLKEVKLVPRELTTGIWVLLSTADGANNCGFIVGERGVLVVDGGANAAYAEMILREVRKVTKKPILYLVNTNYHGDHTFGNYAFPPETQIIAQAQTAAKMADLKHFDQDKENFKLFFADAESVTEGVRWRHPDIVFNEYLRIDLGGKVVELHYFGPAQTVGDTVVFVPETRVAWTGNLVPGKGFTPVLSQNGGTAAQYIDALARLSQTLDLGVIVTAHGPAGEMTSRRAITKAIYYLTDLLDLVDEQIGQGRTLEETIANVPLSAMKPPPGVSSWRQAIPLLQGNNVLHAYRQLAQTQPTGTGPR